MSRKEPTRHQLSSRLAYDQRTPAFLQKLKNRVAGVTTAEDDLDDEFDEWEATSGRPPIPRRPTPPQRPDGDPGSADDDADDDDEAPQVVVLKKGKHLTEREAENERRNVRGLSPLPDDSDAKAGADTRTSQPTQIPGATGPETKSKPTTTSLSFSSTPKADAAKLKKRKLGVVQEQDELDELANKRKGPVGSSQVKEKSRVKTKAKTKKAKTGALLSFGDDG